MADRFTLNKEIYETIRCLPDAERLKMYDQMFLNAFYEAPSVDFKGKKNLLDFGGDFKKYKEYLNKGSIGRTDVR